MIFVLLTGIIVVACVLAALLWSIYRVVVTSGKLRINYALLSLSTIVVVAAIYWNFPTMTLTVGATCVVTGLIATWVEPRWNKLLPLVQVILGVLAMLAGLDVLITGVISSYL